MRGEEERAITVSPVGGKRACWRRACCSEQLMEINGPCPG